MYSSTLWQCKDNSSCLKGLFNFFSIFCELYKCFQVLLFKKGLAGKWYFFHFFLGFSTSFALVSVGVFW